jgi:membrane-bound lytic murein transglycosylase B
MVCRPCPRSPDPCPCRLQSRNRSPVPQWLQTDLWPQAQKSGISEKAAFKAAFADVKLNWDLPDLVPPGSKPPGEQKQSQAEFSSPGAYFSEQRLQGLAAPAAALPRKMPRRSGGSRRPTAFRVRSCLPSGAANPVSAGRKSRIRSWTCSPPRPSCRRAAICSARELIAALHILDSGDVTPAEMKGSWAGAWASRSSCRPAS